MSEKLPTAPVTITLSLDARTPFTRVMPMLIVISNDHDVDRSFWSSTPSVQVNLLFHDGPGDDYRISVHVDGYATGGGFVHANPRVHQTVNLLLIPKPATFEFPTWVALNQSFPATARLITGHDTDAVAQQHYTELGNSRPLALASLMNLAAAMAQIKLSALQTPLDFIKEVIWDETLAQDRFFGFADSGIIPLVQAAAADGEFAEEKDPQNFHKGATLSYKQTQFDYSNVQLTFHGNDNRLIGETLCVKIEPDMDLYKALPDHGILEVIPNLSTGGLTNPLDVLALRWIDAVQGDGSLFDPGYVLS